MCGDYNSVIGMNKENSLKKFLKDKEVVKHFPAVGEGTLSGVIVETNTETGLAKTVTRLIDGGSLVK
jgi:calcineurin-like phosphoesterase